MAIIEAAPYDYYKYHTLMAYLVNGSWVFERPDCISWETTVADICESGIFDSKTHIAEEL